MSQKYKNKVYLTRTFFNSKRCSLTFKINVISTQKLIFCRDVIIKILYFLGVSKGQTEKSSTNTKKDAKEDEKANKAVGKSKSVKTETKNDSLAEDSKETQNKEKSKSSEKSKAEPSKKESGKDGKSGTQDEKSKEKPKGGKGKKGKQKVGKGKNDHSVKEAGGNDIDEGIDNKKTELATKSDASSGKETDNISEAKSGESKDKEIVEQDSKSETYSSQAITSEENVKETKAQPGADVTGTPGKEASSDSQENLTLEEKVALIKSPSSQSIIRPAPDHTDKEEAVLEKLAGAAQEKKVINLCFINECTSTLYKSNL